MGFTLEAFNLLLVVQASQATVGGTVRDEESGRPLPGAVVSLPDLSRAVAADGAGRYVLRHVPPGPQHITVRYVGYAPRGLHALVPPAGPLEINVFLKAQPVRLRTIEVRSAVPVTGLEVREEGDLSDRSSSIAAVRNNPMLAEPDVLQALEGGPVVLQPESPNGVHIRGGASDQTGYLLDGIPVFSPYHAAGQFSAWNPDALSAVYLFSSAPLQEYPGALSGTIAATTKVPGERLGVQGSVSTAQARLTVDGQIGGTGVGYLWSARSRVPGIPAKRHDASYLRAESGDMMAKLELPAFAGRLRLLAYDSGNEIEAAARAEGSSPQARPNEFEWDSRSFGAEWSRNLTGTEVKVTGWSASGDAGAVWAGSDGRTTLSSARHDFGLVGTVELGAPGARTLAGVRLHRSRTAYRAEPDSAALWSLRANTPSAAAFARHTRGLDRRSSLTLGAMLATTGAGLHLGPSAQIRWKPVERWTLSASYARVHQFAQSLRNPQSVVGNVFPMDLYIGSGAPGVPAARSDQAVLLAEYLPFTGGRVALEAYTRVAEGLLLVAPESGGPFATDGFAIGSGRSSGLSVDAAVSSAHYGLHASYGLQRTRLSSATSGYVPDYGTTHLLQGGVIVFPTATTSIRLGAAGALGRRTTAVTGGLEWESCNLLDQGCEFAGSPEYAAGSEGATAVPAYLRVDLGVKKHWHVQVGGRDAMVALFATVTNLLGRTNILNYVEGSDGQQVPVEMRPLAPLVLGLDWQF